MCVMVFVIFRYIIKMKMKRGLIIECTFVCRCFLKSSGEECSRPLSTGSGPRSSVPYINYDLCISSHAGNHFHITFHTYIMSVLCKHLLWCIAEGVRTRKNVSVFSTDKTVVGLVMDL
jgi:hypothetical protein